MLKKKYLLIILVSFFIISWLGMGFYCYRQKQNLSQEISNLKNKNDELKSRINNKKDEIVKLSEQIFLENSQKLSLFKSFDNVNYLYNSDHFDCMDINESNEKINTIKTYLQDSRVDSKIKWICFKDGIQNTTTYLLVFDNNDYFYDFYLYKEIKNEVYENRRYSGRKYFVQSLEKFDNFSLLNWDRNDNLLYSIKKTKSTNKYQMYPENIIDVYDVYQVKPNFSEINSFFDGISKPEYYEFNKPRLIEQCLSYIEDGDLKKICTTFNVKSTSSFLKDF